MGFDEFLKFKKLDPKTKIFYPIMPGDVGYDFCSIEDVVIKSKSSARIRTGLSIEIPENYWVVVRTRSSYGIKNNLQLHHGTIDSSYRGEITVKVFNHGNEDYKITCGDRIAQLVILPKITLPLKEVKELTQTERGFSGMGSTGK